MKNKRHVALITAVSLILTLIFSFPVFADICPYEKAETGTESKEYVPGEAIICICPEFTDEKRIAEGSAGLFSAAPEIESDFLMDVSNAAKSIEEEKGEGFKGFPSGEAVADRRLMRAYITPKINFLSGQRDTSSGRFAATVSPPGLVRAKRLPLASSAPRGEGSAVLKLVKSDTFSTEELIKLYSGKPGVLFAEPNYIIKPEYTKDNDPIQENKLLRSSPEDSKTPDLTTLTQYEFGDGPGGINVPGWNDPANKNAEGVVVAVLDSGVDYENEDLKNVMWDEGEKIQALKDLGGGKYGINTGYEYYVGEEGKTEKDDPMDYIGHGTHCAGIIAAEWNGFGISGAANGARIMAVKLVVDIEGNSNISDTVAGFNYIRTARDNGVNVAAVNCSFGEIGYNLAYLYGLRELCRDDDIVVCCSSGNKNDSDDVISHVPSGLSDLPQLIAVDSMDKEGKKSYFSNYGKRTTHLFAPGTGIMSTIPNAQRKVVADIKISVPVKDNNGKRVYDSFDSDDSLNNYKFTDGTVRQIENGELKISGNIPVVEIDGHNGRHMFTIKTSLPDLPAGNEYNLIFSKRISDTGIWYFPVLAKPKDGGEEELISYDFFSADSDYSYEILPIDGKRYDLKDLELKFCLIEELGIDQGEPVKDASIGEIWITDAGAYPYTSYDGTSMAAPAVAGEAAILAAEFPEDSASKRVARILAGTEPDDEFKNMCITGGKANVGNAIDRKYTPVISSIKAEGDGLHIKGFFFGTEDHTDVSLSQGENTWSVSGKSLELLGVRESGDNAGEILLKTPQVLKNEEVKVTVTDSGKAKDRQCFERILSPEDPDELLEKGNYYKRIPVSEAYSDDLLLMFPLGGFALNGTLYFQCLNNITYAKEAFTFRDGEWGKPEDEINAYGAAMTRNGRIIYADPEDKGTLVIHDGNRELKRIKFSPEKTDIEVPDDMEWVFDPADKYDDRIDLYYDGKDAILVRSREKTDMDTGVLIYTKSVVYSLDPESGKGTYLGALKNYYNAKIIIAHEEKPGSHNTFYFLGKGFDDEGNPEDFVAEKVTLDPFATEDISDIKPDDYTIGEYEFWFGCGVKNGIYLVGGRNYKDDEGIQKITCDNYFFDYSKPEEGFSPCEERINDTVVYPVSTAAAYGKVYFLGYSKTGLVFCYTEADTLPNYGDTPEKKIDYSDPASPLHLTDGSDVEKLSTDNAKYVFTLSSNTAVIGGTKSDISGFFGDAPGFDSSAKHRYISSDKKIARVSKKGIVTAKKKGEAEITCEQKVKGGTWEPLAAKMHLYVQMPEMVKKADVNIGDSGLSAYSFLSKTTYSPTAWISTNTKVATVDENGNITILKPGRTNIIAEYGEGKTGSKKKFKTKLKVG